MRGGAAAALLGTAFVLAAAPAGADALDERIKRIETRMAVGGWTPLSPPAHVPIRAGAVGAYFHAFTAGQGVAAAAACGEEARAEVRLRLLGPDGVQLARAYAIGDGWALEAEIQETGEHILVISAEGCAADPCRVGLLTFARWPD